MELTCRDAYSSSRFCGCLGGKLGPILWQFPPGFGFNEERFDEFFTMLPRTTKKAAALARKHDVALVFADTAGRWPYMEDVTSNWIYVRLHGDEELYVSGYTDAALDWWASRIEAWRCGEEPADPTRITELKPRKCRNRDVFVYFDNDVKVRAPFDAMGLARRLGVAMNIEQRTALDVRKIGEIPRERWPGLRRRVASR